MKYLYFFILSVLIAKIEAQTLTGKLSNAKGEALILANVLIKEADKPTVISEFVVGRNGTYSITLKKTYTKILIEVTANNYFPEVYILEKPQKDQTYALDFVLQENTAINLKEIVVESKKDFFEIKGDTTSYDVKSYADGSERKIQEIIKKLPGVELNEKTGEIKYKGKSIETVLLEGDNLFDYNYTLGTKNINADMVEQVQAIERYTENPLLKGIENSDKVALNLKLKKGKFDFSGTVQGGVGLANDGKLLGEAYSNLLGITKNFKSFGTLAFNNVGINHSPFDYLGFQQNVEQMKEQNFFAPKVIPETAFFDFFDEGRSNINRQWFGNFNSIFKIDRRLSVKSNLYYISDNIFSEQLFENINSIDNQTFTTSDFRTIRKKPLQYRGDLELKFNSSKTSLLEYKLRIRQENINTPTQVLANGQNDFESELQSEDFYFKQSLLFTHKLSSNKVLQVSLFQSVNDIPQRFRISPSVFNPIDFQEDTQQSNAKKNYWEGKAIFLGATQKTKYSLALGAILNENPFLSALFSTNGATNAQNNISSNNVDYTQKSFYTSGAYHWSLGRWKFSPTYTFSFLNQMLKNNLESTEDEVENLIFEPAFSINFRVTNISNLTGKVSYNQSPVAERNTFANQILTSNRTTVGNTPSLDLQERLGYSLSYRISDMYNQFGMVLSMNYQQITGNFFSDFNIQPNTTQIHYFFAALPNDNLSFDYEISRFITQISALVDFKVNYSIANYKNILNNSELRNNRSNFFDTKLSVSTAFDTPFNFKNHFNFSFNQAQNEGNAKFSNSALNNALEINYTPNKHWFWGLTSNIYFPNLDNATENFLFLDFSLLYRPENKRLEWSFVAHNLLNQTNFRQVETTDFSLNIFQTNLFHRYFLVNLSYDF